MLRSERIVVFLMFIISLPLVAQVPDWYEATSRRVFYPSEKWYTGFVIGEQRENESVEDAIVRLKNEARAELVASISTTIEHSSNFSTSSDLQQSSSDFNEDIRETYVSNTRISSNINDISGLHIETYISEGFIAAFAYVKKDIFVNILIRRITFELAKAEGLLPLIEQQTVVGNKREACVIAKNGVQLLNKVEEIQNLLIIVDNTVDTEILQLKQTRELQQYFAKLIADLKKGTAIYISCVANLFEMIYSGLKDDIQNELSCDEYYFVDNLEQSDWAIDVICTAREYSTTTYGGVTTYFTYVDAQISINKSATNKQVYKGKISEKGSHLQNFEQAAYDAYKQISSAISEIVKKQIQQ